MTRRMLLPLMLFLTALPVAAAAPVIVQVQRDNGSVYIVEGTFAVTAGPEVVWSVLTDYDGIAQFVSSIRESTVKRREPGRVLLEQHGVGNAWIIRVPIHVVLDVREEDGRILAFRDVCGKSFSTYEGQWAISPEDSGTRVVYRLKADPNGRQPARLAQSAIRGSVKKLLDEVRSEILARAAR